MPVLDLARSARARTRRWPASYFDTGVSAVLFCAGFGLCLAHLANVGLGEFYRLSFNPAISLACTGKLKPLELKYGVEPPAELKAVRDFLVDNDATLQCSQVPTGFDTTFHDLQYQTLYLIVALGIVWSITGLSWPAAFIVAGILTGALVLAVYGICRLFISIWWAIPTTIVATLSPWQEIMIPALRDYAKAPFILGVILCSGLLLKFRADFRRAAAFSAMAGVVAGLGFGVRTDLAIAVPFFFIVLGTLLLWTKFRAWLHVAAYGALFSLAFGLVSLPVLTAYRGGGIVGHVSLLGLTTYFNPALGLNPAPYDLGHVYNDPLAYQITQAYAAQFPDVAPPDSHLVFSGPEYNRLSLGALIDFARHFPADIVIRAYSAIIRIVNVDLGPGNLDSQYRLDGPRKQLLWPTLGVHFLAAALICVAAAEPLMAVFLVLVVAYFGGLGALQFHYRHMFHLEFIYWLAQAIIAASLWQVARAFLWRRQGEPRPQPYRVLHAVGLVAALFGAVMLLLMAARNYQQSHAAALFDRYLAAERQSVQIEEVQRGDTVLLRPVGQAPNLHGMMVTREERPIDGFYFVAQLDETRCPSSLVSMKATYRPGPNHPDQFSRTLQVPVHGATHLFFLATNCVNHCSQVLFDGLVVASDQRACVTGLEAVKNFRSLPLPLWLRLSGNWRADPLYQTRINGLWPLPQLHLFTDPWEVRTAIDANVLTVNSLQQSSWAALGEPTVAAGTGLRIVGAPKTWDSDAAVSQLFRLPKGTLVAARGTVSRGGIEFGLRSPGVQGWQKSATIRDGKFLVVFEVPAAGDYQLVVANRLRWTGLHNNVEITEIGLVGRDPSNLRAP